MFIAHRGASRKKKQNTTDAFAHASQSDAFGIETDVRVTKDGVFVAFHDKSAARLSGRHLIIEKTEFAKVQKLTIFDRQRRHSIPTFVDFLRHCQSNGKVAVVDIKSNLTTEQADELLQIVDVEGYLPRTIFISFNKRILQYIRSQLPDQAIQLSRLLYKPDDLVFLQESAIGLAICHQQVSMERMAECHARGIEVNAWTVNSERRAQVLQQWGVNFITTNRLFLGDSSLHGGEQL